MDGVEEQGASSRIKRLYRVFGPYLRPYRARIALAYVNLGLSIAMMLLRPWPLKLVLDGVILDKRRLSESVPFVPPWVDGLDPYLLVTLLSASLVVIVLLESAFGYLQKLTFAYVGQSATTDVLESVYTHLQTLPRGLGSGVRSGDVIVRLTSDIKRLRDLLVDHIQKLGNYGLTFVSTVVVMALLNWKLTLLGLSVVPLIYLASWRFTREIRRASREKRRKEGDVASVVQETLSSLTVIQAFAQEDAERERFRKEARESLEAGIESSRLGGAFSRSVQLLNAAGLALVIWFGARQVLDGVLSPGDLVVFAAYIAEVYKPVQSLSELAGLFSEAVISGERVLEMLLARPRVKDRPHAIKPSRVKGEIAFEDVVFGYEPGCPVLQGLTFRAEPGQRVALVGESGSGKSTVLNLLLRFVEPESGRILVDGRDVRDYKLRGLREQISIVLQEPVLFRRPVAENIAYGKPHARVEEIVAAAKAAQAHEFITAMPDGYNTVLEERGTNLSGGQRQRISVARAFLRNRPILILDEPTTGLDAVTEGQLSETLRELARGRTTLVIAHKLATIADADSIIVLERGRVAEQGSHAELMQARGRYWRLHEARARAS
jgi:ABC-type multidrug transport system fused ATPase/permease subunit